jgi:maltose-binding protein MalE
MLKYAKPTPVNKNYAGINDMLQEGAQDIFAGDKRAEDVFNEAFILKLENLL